MAKKKPNKGNKPNNGQKPSNMNRNVSGNRPAAQNRSMDGNPSMRGNRPSGMRPIPSDGQRPIEGRRPMEAPSANTDRRPLIRDARRKKEEEKRSVKDTLEIQEQTPPSYVNEIADSDEVRRSHMAKKRKRDALKASFNAFLSIAILVGVLCIAVLYVVDYVAAKPKYAFVTIGSIEHTIGAEALILRNEQVTLSENSGTLLTQATEGSRVSRDQLLAMVIPEGMEGTLTELRSVERQIVDIERELMEEGKVDEAKTIFNEINAEIEDTADKEDALEDSVVTEIITLQAGGTDHKAGIDIRLPFDHNLRIIS